MFFYAEPWAYTGFDLWANSFYSFFEKKQIKNLTKRKKCVSICLPFWLAYIFLFFYGKRKYYLFHSHNGWDGKKALENIWIKRDVMESIFLFSQKKVR